MPAGAPIGAPVSSGGVRQQTPIGAPVGSRSAAIGAPAGRKLQWAGSAEAWGSSSLFEDPGGFFSDGAGSSRGSSERPHDGSTARRSMWDEHQGHAGGEYGSEYGTEAELRRSMWDERAGGGGGGAGGRDGSWRGCTGKGASAAVAPSAGKSRNTIVVGGIPDEALEVDVRKTFEKAQLVVDRIVFPMDREGNWTGVAHVNLYFEDGEDPEVAVDFAMHKMKGAEVCGQPVSLELKSIPWEDEGDSYGYGGGHHVPSPGYGSMPGYMGMQRMMAGQQPIGGGYGPAAGYGATSSTIGRPPMPPTARPVRKTQICTYWKENRCTRGPFCAFAHGEQELDPEVRARRAAVIGMGVGPGMGMGMPIQRPTTPMPVPPVPPKDGRAPVGGARRTQLCIYWKEGRCTRGAQCMYSHGEADRFKDGTSRKPGEDASRPRRDAPRPTRIRNLTFSKKETVDASKREEACVTEGILPQEVDSPDGADQDQPSPDVKDDVEVKGSGDEDSKPSKKRRKGPADKDKDTARWLVDEDAAELLDSLYGLGATLVKAMGWKPGIGLGRKGEGNIEPISVHTLKLPSTHYGSKDRRCLGVKQPRKFKDSDEETRSCSSSSRSSSRRSSRSSSSKRSRASRRRSKSVSVSTRSRSRSKSSSSSSSSSKSKKLRSKSRRGSGISSPPKAGGAAAGGAAGTAVAAATKPVNEPPEISMAKKQVLAKLTVMKNIESKEQRQKEFRVLLREWHPDKNPEKIEMATAVFQFLQRGKSLLNLK